MFMAKFGCKDMDNPPPILESSAPAPGPPVMSLTERLTNMFVAPGEVFDEVKKTAPSGANWLTPALIFILISWVGGYFIFSQEAIRSQVTEMAEQSINKQLAKMEKTRKTPLSNEEADKIREMGTKWAVPGSVIGFMFTSLVVAFIVPFWGGLVVWLVGTKVFKGAFPYMKGVEVAGLAATINGLEALVRVLLILVLGNLLASTSLALLVKNINPQNPTFSLLAAFNIMTFWGLAVRSVGLSRLSGASFGKAAAWVFGIWALVTAVFVGFSAAMQAVGKQLGGG